MDVDLYPVPPPEDPGAPVAPPPAPVKDKPPEPDPLAGWQALADLPEDWLERRPQEARRLLSTADGKDCFLRAGKVSLLLAPGGRGKSAALADLAVAVASGGKWLRTYPVAAPGRVLLAYGEEEDLEAQRRLHGVARAHGLTRDERGTYPASDSLLRLERLRQNLSLLPLYGRPCALQDPACPDAPTPFYAALRDRLARQEWALIVLDPGSRFMGPDSEADNAAATRFVELAEALTQLPGRPTVLLAHHSSKTYLQGRIDQGAARGSSALVDGARWAAGLDRPMVCLDDEEENAAMGHLRPLGLRPESFVSLRVVKTNYGPPVAPLHLVNDKGTLRPADDPEALALSLASNAIREVRKAKAKRRKEKAE